MPVRNTSYPQLRQQLSPEYAEASDQRIEAVLRNRNIDAEAMEGFLSDLGRVASSVGQAVVKAAPSVLPVAGQIVGTAFGGPVGAAIGGQLGSLAGGAIGAATGQRPAAGGGLPGIGAIPGLGSLLGSPAAGQLLQTLFRPQTIQALTSMALGPLGKPNISIAGTPVPVGAFGNLLSTLAGRAEAEYNESVASTRGTVPRYMQDYAGEAKGDPAISEHRAEALYGLLEFADSEAEGAESEAAEAERFNQEMEAFLAEYEAMEVQEAQEAEAY